MKRKENSAPLAINIQLFAEGAEGAEASEATAESTDAQVETTDTEETQAEVEPDDNVIIPEDRSAEFEKLIKGDFKEEFAKRTQRIIDGRFKETKRLEESQKQVQPILQKLTSKYGVSANDIEALSKAIDNDDAVYAEFAEKNGITLDQARHIKTLEAENEMFKQTQEERQRQEKADKVYQKWIKQSEQAKQLYPDFDLGIEMQNEQFAQLMQNGIDIKTAYEVVHKDEILTRVATVSAKKAEKQIVDTIKAKGNRPAENGMSSQGAVSTSKDIRKLSNDEMDDYIRRARQGERIDFKS